MVTVQPQSQAQEILILPLHIDDNRLAVLFLQGRDLSHDLVVELEPASASRIASALIEIHDIVPTYSVSYTCAS